MKHCEKLIRLVRLIYYLWRTITDQARHTHTQTLTGRGGPGIWRTGDVRLRLRLLLRLHAVVERGCLRAG